MKKFLTHVKNILADESTISITIKLVVLSCLLFMGYLWNPLMAVVCTLAIIFMLCEHSKNSLIYILYFFPSLNLFSFKNEYGLSYWFILVLAYCAIVGVRFIIALIKRKDKLNLTTTIMFGVLFLIVAIPFGGTFNLISVAESLIWLSLLYLIFVNINEYDLKKLVLVTVSGFLFSCFSGLFVKRIPYIANNIILYYSDNLMRFSGSFINPNLFYSFGLVCFCLIGVLILNKNLKLLYALLLIPLFAFSYASLSKTYFVSFLIVLIFFLVSVLIKCTKYKLKVFGIIVVIITAVIGGMFSYTKAYYNRFFNSEYLPIERSIKIQFDKEVYSDIEKFDNEKNTGEKYIGGEYSDGKTKTNGEYRERNTQHSIEIDTKVNTLTTGRLESWMVYFKHIVEEGKLLYGFGINTAHGLIETNSHNTYLQLLYEFGIVGYLAVIGIGLYYLFKTKFKLFKTLDKGYYLPFVAFACFCMTENLLLSQLGNMLFILACLSLHMIQKNQDKEAEVICFKNNKKQLNTTVAVLTPTYNREKLLSRLYGSLKNQTNKNFKWHIIDDGSKDNTENLITSFINEKILDISYDKKENGGKHTALNVGLHKIEEPITIIVDSDDWLAPNAIETIINDFAFIKDNRNICGIGYLKGTDEKCVVGNMYTKDGIVDSFINQRYNKNVHGDKAEVFKTDILKQYPFPEFEGENFISETIVWCKMSQQYKMAFVNRIIYNCEYQQDGLSNGIHKRLIQNPKGSTECYNALCTKDFNLKNRIKHTILYDMYSLCAGRGIKETIKNANAKFLSIVLFPIAFILKKYREKKYNL